MALKLFIETIQGYWLWFRMELLATISTTSRPTIHYPRNLLVVATLLPPTISGGVYRPLSWFRFAKKRGWKINAISLETPTQRTDASDLLVSMIPEDANIYRARPCNLKTSWKLFPRIDGGFVEALQMATLGFRELKAQPPSVVVATGPEFCSFVAGYFIAKRFGAKLILDYRDEWTQCPFDFVDLGNMDKFWEKRSLKYADKVLFTTTSHIDQAINHLPFLNPDKCQLVMNGWEPGDRDSVHEASTVLTNLPEGMLTITFTGLLGNHTLPESFLTCFKALLSVDSRFKEHIRLVFVGRRSNTASQQLSSFPHPDTIVACDHIPKTQIHGLQDNSDALLIISNDKLSRYLPGKLFDYLASPRPIIVYGYEGEVSSLVKSLNAGWFVQEGDSKALASVLTELRHAPLTSWDTKERRDWCKSHTRECMADIFFDEIDEVIN